MRQRRCSVASLLASVCLFHWIGAWSLPSYSQGLPAGSMYRSSNDMGFGFEVPRLSCRFCIPIDVVLLFPAPKVSRCGCGFLVLTPLCKLQPALYGHHVCDQISPAQVLSEGCRTPGRRMQAFHVCSHTISLANTRVKRCTPSGGEARHLCNGPITKSVSRSISLPEGAAARRYIQGGLHANG